jgi:L-amino acid ligase
MTNILIVDGFLSGSGFVKACKQKKYKVFHILSDIIDSTIEEKPELSSLNTLVSKLDYSDKFIPSNFSSYTHMIDELKKYNFSAVIPGLESAVLYAEKIANSLNLPTNDPNNKTLRVNKFKQQKILKENGLNYIPFILTSNAIDAIDFFYKNNFDSIVVKNTVGAGSNGVYKCLTEEDIENAFKKLLGAKNIMNQEQKEVLVEEFIEGEEVAVNCVSAGDY